MTTDYKVATNTLPFKVQLASYSFAAWVICMTNGMHLSGFIVEGQSVNSYLMITEYYYDENKQLHNVAFRNPWNAPPR